MTNNAEELAQYLILLQTERPLFEANYVENGGDLQLLKWDACSDGTGKYQPDWSKLSEINHESTEDEIDFDEGVSEHASHVQGCLMAWIECAKSKAIPSGYYLMPIQPCEEMLKQAECEFADLNIDDIQDRIVFSHQAMINVLAKANKQN